MIRQPARLLTVADPAAARSLASQQRELDPRMQPWRDQPLEHVPVGDPLRTNFGAKPSVRAALAASTRIGSFNKCAWCEGHIYDDQSRSEGERLTVEHVRPVHSYPWLQASWTNFVAACGACNHGRGRRASRQRHRVEDFPLVHGGISRLLVGEAPPGIVGREMDGAAHGWCVVDPMDPIEIDPAAIVHPRVSSQSFAVATFPTRVREVVAWLPRAGLSRALRLRARGMIPAVLHAGGDVVAERRARWILDAIVPRIDDLRMARSQSEADRAWQRLCVRARPSQRYSLVVWEMLGSPQLSTLRTTWSLVVPNRP